MNLDNSKNILKPLLALSGKMACGKSTVSRILSDTFDYQVLSIASPIKKTAILLIENTSELETYLIDMISNHHVAKSIYEKLYFNFELAFLQASWEKNSDGTYNKNDDYRKLLQRVATIVRDELGEDIWVKFFAKEAKALSEKGRKVICDDLRLPSEMKVLQKNGFSIIRINVDEEVQKQRLLELYGEINHKLLNHPTETSLDSATDFDFIINTGKNSLEYNIELLKTFVEESN